MDERNASPVQAGDVLAGKFRVEKVLGVGGMGVVVQALHLELERRVAVKFMLRDVATSAELVARFLREARAAARLQSEHVVRVLDVGRFDTGEPYMVMEFLAGEDLAQHARGTGPLAPDRMVDMIVQGCEAIAEAHTQGIIHRDLKPSNLFLARRADGAPLVKVLDFGISKVTATAEGAPFEASMTSTQSVLGSPAYMSPEQMRSAKHVDARSDIWALGIIMHELLAGQPVWEADSLPGLVAMVTADTAPSLAKRRPGLAPALEAAIMRCLEKEPSRRWQSVAELVDAIAPFGTPEASDAARRVVRIQRGAGLTVLDTQRPPVWSAPQPAQPAQSNAVQNTAATFGVTARSTASRGRLMAGFAAAALAVAAVVAIAVYVWRAPPTVAGPDSAVGAPASGIAPDPATAASALAGPAASEMAPASAPPFAPVASQTAPAASASAALPPDTPSPHETTPPRPPPSPSKTAKAQPPPSTTPHPPQGVDLAERK